MRIRDSDAEAKWFLTGNDSCDRIRYDKKQSVPALARPMRIARGLIIPFFRLRGISVFPQSFFGGVNISAKEMLINDDIPDIEVRAIGVDGNQLGIISAAEAKKIAYEAGVDLVMIAPQATPPVVRAMDYGKYKYESLKREKDAKKKSQTIEIKEVQLSCRIDVHDFETKANRAIKFLQDGNRVHVSLRFKGREIAHSELGHAMLQRFADAVSEYGQMDKAPKMEGRQVSCVISPIKKK